MRRFPSLLFARRAFFRILGLPQYKGLEELYSRYKDKGLVVLGFPSNDFAQEKGSNKEIADFF